jgi:hypothetical protein
MVLLKKYPGQIPMTPFGGMLNDEEVAAVLTYAKFLREESLRYFP